MCNLSALTYTFGRTIIFEELNIHPAGKAAFYSILKVKGSDTSVRF
jgi:hypothetical protein